jgi:HK97 gp10 family phage protein
MPKKVLEGGEVLVRRFAKLSREARGITLTAATVAGAVVVREEAKALAPRGAGSVHAADHIEIEAIKATPSRASVNIGYDKTKAWYLKFLEIGTKFISARPHLRPALHGQQDTVMRAVPRTPKGGHGGD